MLPTSSYSSLAAASASVVSGRAPSTLGTPTHRPRMLLVMVPTVVLLLLGLLFLPGVVQGDYENTWNSYYEQPCCGGTTNGPFHLRHHGDHVREFQCGKFYYRTFYMDEDRDTLYVGAMNRVYKLNLKNISMTSCE
ncbi:semaphorin-2A-like, partial [Anopheles stephensi]|uniref:semaphorin-2A-like n=1 Tax=Anopheles stephensi TaxID=30069 RepID=UPI0016587B37